MGNNLFNYTAVLYALGWAIAHSLWQMGILWLTFQLFFGFRKNQKPAVRYAGSITLIVGGFSWFLITFFNQFRQYQLFNRYLEQLPVSDPRGLDLGTTLKDSGAWLDSSTLFTLFEKYIPFRSAGYLIILILLTVRLINAYAFTQRLKSTGLIPAGEYLDNKLSQFVKMLRIPGTVKIYLSELIDVPATIGFLKPVILLPIATMTQLSSDQVEAIILHELAHIRRRDYLLNMVVAVMETVLFFNPFVHLLTVNLKKERELFCDDFVVSFNKNPRNYASALLSVEKMRRNQEMILAVAATGHDGVLLTRVKRILNIKTTSIQYKEKIVALVFISILLSTLAWINPVPVEKPVSVKVGRDVTAASSDTDSVEVRNIATLIKRDFQAAQTPVKLVTKKINKPAPLKSTGGNPELNENGVPAEATALYSYSFSDVFPPASTYETAEGTTMYRTPEPFNSKQYQEENGNFNFKYNIQFNRIKAADSIIKARYLEEKGKIGNREFQQFVDNVRGMQEAGFHFSPWFLQKMTALYRNELNNSRNVRSTRGINSRRIPEKEKDGVSFSPEMSLVYALAPSFGTTVENDAKLETEKPSEPFVQLQPILSGTVSESFLATPPLNRASVQVGNVYGRKRKTVSITGPEEEADIPPTAAKKAKVKTATTYGTANAVDMKFHDVWISGSGNNTDTAFHESALSPEAKTFHGYSYRYAPVVRQKVSGTVKTTVAKESKQKITIVIETSKESINIEVDAGKKQKQIIDL